MIGFNPKTKESKRGFAFLVAIVLASVAAAITLALTTLAYKALVLASSVEESQYAFYAADTALECALYWDNRNHLAFQYGASQVNGQVGCEGLSTMPFTVRNAQNTTEFQSAWFPVSSGAGCAQITVFKAQQGSGIQTSIYGDGVANATCPNYPSSPTLTPRSTERGIKAFYGQAGGGNGN